MTEKSDKQGKLWELFSSMKLGLALLGIIAFVAAIGTFFPQISQEPDKARAVGQVWQALGLTHLYSTVWFRLLLGLLSLNLIVCSVQRFSGIYRRTFKPLPPESAAGVPRKIRAEIEAAVPVLRQAVERVMPAMGYRLTTADKEEMWTFVGMRHRWGNWGSVVTHLSFVVLLVGALLGSALGFRGYFMAAAGEVVPIQQIQIEKGKVSEDFSVRINSAEDRFLPNGERDNWYTDLSILESGKEVGRQTISVNHPFTYRGITFYQASFANGARFTADIKGQKIPVMLQDQGGNYFQAPGTDLYLIVAAMQGGSGQAAVMFQVYKGQGSQPVQTGQLTVGESADVQGQYQLTFDGSTAFTGLQVKRDPGVWVIWLGSALLLVGLMLSFYWSPRIVSGVLEMRSAGQGKLILGLATGKSGGSRHADFDALVGTLKERLTSEMATEEELQ
ncbi:MAG: cytochrome c biogenesis protein ResB [Desulfitobacteriaceae bacterium]